MLYRKIESLIEKHLKADSKKILLIDGARQMGKTYIIRHVGQKLFENYIYTNQQRIISNSDISFCVYTFQNVTKAEDPSIRTPVTHSNGSMNSFF